MLPFIVYEEQGLDGDSILVKTEGDFIQQVQQLFVDKGYFVIRTHWVDCGDCVYIEMCKRKKVEE